MLAESQPLHEEGAPIGVTTDRPAVAILRGEALNPYEMQAYGPLLDRFDLLAVGRHRPPHEVSRIPMPSVLLHSVGERRTTRSVHRRISRHARALPDPDRLIGLTGAVEGRQILHAAETVLPVSEQAARLVQRTTRRLVLTCWETIPFRYDDDPRLAARKLVVKAETSLYVAVTQRARTALLAEGAPDDDIVVIPAAVDCERFRPQAPSAARRISWGVGDAGFVVLYVGRLIQEKGVVELVRAFAQGLEGDAHLVLLGSGDQAERVRIAATALGVADRVHVVPAASYADLPEIYGCADLVVAPSLTTPYWEEQFGMVLVETMSCGRPLLTTRSGAIPEVVGDAAHLVDPYAVDHLAQALRMLRDDAPYRAALAQAGRRRAEAVYAVPVVAEQLARAYLSVLPR